MTISLVIYSTDQKKPNRERLTERVLFPFHTRSHSHSVSTAAWTSREILIAYWKANNVATTQQNLARSDKASLGSAGAGFPMFTTFIKDVTPEIFNPHGLRMVSVYIYAANFSAFQFENISFMTSTVSRPVRWNCFFCWSIPAASFATSFPGSLILPPLGTRLLLSPSEHCD